METKIINVAKDFSKYPSGRYPSDSRFSGERFREDFLIGPLSAGDAVEIHMDGTLGYGSSFLDEAFGGLVRIHKLTRNFLSTHIKLISSRDDLIEEIWSYMK